MNDWPFDPDYGLEEDWVFEVIPGNPRHLVIVGDVYRFEFVEGPWPPPTEGLTAVMRAFPRSSRFSFCKLPLPSALC